MRLDAHQHFWRYEPAGYPWIRPDWPIRRHFLPADLKPFLDRLRIDGCIAVQARQNLDETRWLLSLVNECPFIKGVVGWVDLCHSEIDRQLAQVAHDSRLVGVRHVVQDEPDDGFMLRAEFSGGISRLERYNLAYDILIYPRQLPAAIQLVRRFPRQRFVLDHMAKPLVKIGVLSPWSEHIRQLAQFPNVFCKLSGLVTEAAWKAWRAEDFTPYLDVVLEAFGPNRLMYGSDWPVCLLAASYSQAYEVVADYCSRLTACEEQQIFGLTALQFYLHKRKP